MNAIAVRTARTRMGWCAFLGVMSAFALPVWAAEPSSPTNQAVPRAQASLADLSELEVPTVYGASRQTQKITEAPSSVNVVSADEIKKYGYRTLGDLLASLQGFHVTYDRNNAFLGVRGFNRGLYPNSRVLVLVDGHRLNNNLYDGGPVGTEFILDLDLIDRVEVIRGPGSVLYGNNAFFGVINVVTQRGRDLHSLESSLEAASFDTYKGRVTLGNSFKNDVELLLSGTWFESRGPERLFYKEFNKPGNNFGIAQSMDGDSSRSFFGKLAYHDFTLQGAWLWRDKENPTAQFTNTTFNDPRFRTVDERSYVSLQFAHEWPEVVSVTSQLYYDRGDFAVTVPSSVPVPKGPAIKSLIQEANSGEWWGGEAQLKKILFENHVITLGGEYRDDFRLERANLDVATGRRTGPPRVGSRESYGVYAQGDFRLHRTLHLNAGVRYDQYANFAADYNPRVALIYNPVGSTVFKGIYGTAFRAPTFIESINPLSIGLRPENITGFEFVYEQGIGTGLRSILSLFHNTIERQIVFDSTQATYLNAGDATAQGAEAALEGYWAGGLRGRASYTFQQTEDQSTGAVLTDSPRHLAKLNLTVPILRDKLFAGLEWQYTSRRVTLQGTDAPGFGVVNFTLFSQKLAPGLELSASVYNLLDRQYADPATPLHLQDVLPQDGRTFRVKLTYRF